MPLANLPDHSIQPLVSISLRGVYYGYARVLPDPSHGASQSGLETPSTRLEDKDLQIHPMVMSVGWNPYYKNERLTAVSSTNPLLLLWLPPTKPVLFFFFLLAFRKFT